MKYALILFAFAFFAFTFQAPTGFAATYYVPGSFNSIQEAIDGCADGDVIICSPGTYVENIDFKGKALTVMSEMGASVTTVDGNRTGSVVTFNSGEGAGSILEGFTITNGVAVAGGGIYCHNRSSPTIRNNVITINGGTQKGGGIYCSLSSSPDILDNEITANITGGPGGGIHCVNYSCPFVKGNDIAGNVATNGGGVSLYNGSAATITGSTIRRNRALYTGGGIECRKSAALITNNLVIRNKASQNSGGGICCRSSTANIINNTIIENTAAVDGGGIVCNCAPKVTNTIMWDNFAPAGAQIHGGNPKVTYCDVMGGCPGTGNIDADPVLRDGHLLYTSPCKDAGTNLVLHLPWSDIDGDPRKANGVADIGADEFYFHLFQTGDVVPGGSIEIWITGLPGQSVLLAESTTIQDPPVTTRHGDWYLTLPLTSYWHLPGIWPNGNVNATFTVPTTWVPGEVYYYQALIGPWWGPNSQYTRFTNLLELVVE